MKYLNSFNQISSHIITYHGSKYNFYKFETKYINRTVEGWGIYLTTNKRVAYEYSKGILPNRSNRLKMIFDLIKPFNGSNFLYKVSIPNGEYFDNWMEPELQRKEVLKKLSNGEIYDKLKNYKLLSGYKNSIYDALSHICGGDFSYIILIHPQRSQFTFIKSRLYRYSD